MDAARVTRLQVPERVLQVRLSGAEDDQSHGRVATEEGVHHREHDVEPLLVDEAGDASEHGPVRGLQVARLEEGVAAVFFAREVAGVVVGGEVRVR